MRILKFGGSSVANAERIKQVCAILKGYHDQKIDFAVVFSAFGGMTDDLIALSEMARRADLSYKTTFTKLKARQDEIINELFVGAVPEGLDNSLQANMDALEDLLHGIFLLREASARTMDYVLSFGERNTNEVIAYYLRSLGMKTTFVDARNIVITNKDFGSAKVDFARTNELVRQHFKNANGVSVITGFIGADKGGLTTTLGRGGSDYTASILANAIDAEQVEIWTDVSGVLTADPRIVKKAFTIEEMSYEEAIEMSHFGAKVIFPPTMKPVMKKGIPIWIKNTFHPDEAGTLISKKVAANNRYITGISAVSNICLVTLSGNGMVGVPGIAGRLFSSLARGGINIIMITQGSSEHSICFAIQPKQVKLAKELIEEEFSREMDREEISSLAIEKNLSIVAIIGENMRYTPGVAARIMSSLGNNGINVIAIAQGSSELNVSVVVNRVDEEKALNALHDYFFRSTTKTVHLYFLGCGLIGGTLLDQIHQNYEELLADQQLDIRVVGIANTKRMILDKRGIALEDWKDHLVQSEQESNTELFVKEMIQHNLPNSIFVDNTASNQPIDFYKNILANSISISTPNKIATSSSYSNYHEMKGLAKKHNVFFGYETNVGAGLPVLSTIDALVKSGDRIVKIEGVLSGSLSYIFNTFSKDVSFIEAVRKARELGYTEPDPRVDLSGSDVKRKILILARESGLKLEPDHVEVSSFLPDDVMQAETVEGFFDKLENHSALFESWLYKSTEAKGRWRIIAKMEKGEASVGLHLVGQESPFYGLDGADNMIVITSKRYKTRPLVISGPGAGADVTAAGVFAEILTMTSQMSF